MPIDFRGFAQEITQRENIEALLPVVEKELIHYSIIQALDESGWLDSLTFQGGTCLRLCYRAVRYSEDLDFTVSENLSQTDLDGFCEVLTKQLNNRFGLAVEVKPPKKVQTFESGAPMKRWQVVVNTTPLRPDLPSQKIKIEIAEIPSYTHELKILQENYPEISGAYSNSVIPAQSLSEILADKLVAFSLQESVPRYRDLWDIPWILTHSKQDMNEVAEMVAKKYCDYGAVLPHRAIAENGLFRASEEILTQRFISEMKRFLPAETIARTLERPEYLEAMKNSISDAYEKVTEKL